MDIKEHTTPSMLEKYSFMWSEARLVVAALALFLGGVPPLYYFLKIPALYGLERSLLQLAWIISGLASAYLLYRWSKVKTVFGGKNQLDFGAFFVMVVSGINLGLTGILGSNIGMSISSNRGLFLIVGLLYLASLYHLNKRWKENGNKIF